MNIGTKSRSTTEALIAAEHTIMEAMERCNGKPTRAAILSFDVQNAFDSISHHDRETHSKLSIIVWADRLEN